MWPQHCESGETPEERHHFGDPWLTWSGILYSVSEEKSTLLMFRLESSRNHCINTAFVHSEKLYLSLLSAQKFLEMVLWWCHNMKRIHWCLVCLFFYLAFFFLECLVMFFSWCFLCCIISCSFYHFCFSKYDCNVCLLSSSGPQQ